MSTTIRVGAVNYLNTKPLIERLTDFGPSIELSLDLPSRLADQLAAGEIDVGLIPVVEYFRGATDAGRTATVRERVGSEPHPLPNGRGSPGAYSFVPNIAIASRGPVLSVTLFSRVPWPEIRSVALDEGSRTSAALTQILLRTRYGVRPAFEPLPIDAPAEEAGTDAVLLIGDRAMRACLPGFRFAYDLGQEWADWTGLPFVYAVWAVRDGVELGNVEHAFHQAKEYGLAHAGAIAQREAPALGLDPGYCRRYLSHIIHYDLGPRELAGMERFQELLANPDRKVGGGFPHDTPDLAVGGIRQAGVNP
jgi:chorismate dehydratase